MYKRKRCSILLHFLQEVDVKTELNIQEIYWWKQLCRRKREGAGEGRVQTEMPVWHPKRREGRKVVWAERALAHSAAYNR